MIRQILVLFVGSFVLMTVLYVMISLYSASVRREKLEKQWEAEGQPGERAAYVRAGMQVYRQSLRRRLILLVYVVPFALISVTLYLVNFY
jgi:uncharacterized protein involved in cysteine biosynthesis